MNKENKLSPPSRCHCEHLMVAYRRQRGSDEKYASSQQLLVHNVLPGMSCIPEILTTSFTKK